MWFPKRFQKNLSIIIRFLRKLHKKKRKKLNLKTESQIRQRRRELHEIRRNWIENGEENIEDIDVVISEYDWLLDEEKKQDSSSELIKARKKISELKEEKRKLQIAINIARGE